MKNCPECKTEAANNARTCHKCGHQFTTSSGVTIAIIIGVIVGGFVLFLILPK